MRGLISGLRREQPGLDFVVVGSTSDDGDLLRTGDVFVTGAVDAAELEALFRRYRLDRLVLCLTEPMFGHPILSAVMTSVLPVAYFDWSRGRCSARTGDLPLDPSLSTAGAVTRLVPWLRGQQRARPRCPRRRVQLLCEDATAVNARPYVFERCLRCQCSRRTFVVKLNCPTAHPFGDEFQEGKQ